MSKAKTVLSKIIWFWLPVIIWSLLIFTFSSEKLPMVGPSYWPDFAAKKTAHIIEYAIFSVLIYRALLNSGVRKPKAMVIAIIICFLYAITDEMHQSFLPFRTSRVRDVIFDTIGASLSILFIWKLLQKMPKRFRKFAADLQIA